MGTLSLLLVGLTTVSGMVFSLLLSNASQARSEEFSKAQFEQSARQQEEMYARSRADADADRKKALIDQERLNRQYLLEQARSAENNRLRHYGSSFKGMI